MLVVSFLSGLLFAAGLAISGMTQPAKVQGFLDVTGSWDPSLAFVMGGAVLVNLVLFKLIRRRERPLLAAVFDLPTRTRIDARLVAGSAVFGIGWGLGGFCPGPALASLLTLNSTVLLFVGAMVVGMAAHGLLTRQA